MKIALTQRLVENSTYPETRDALDIAWGDWFSDMGWLPLPLTTGHRDPAALLNALAPDALMLTGGNDLSIFSDDPLSRKRDCFETVLVGCALATGLPIIGVCRGAQFLAHRFGAKLARLEGHVACRHPLKTTPDHALAPYLVNCADVNSYHQMGIVNPGPEMVPLAWSPDGALEAFTHVRHPLLAIMWHPEREKPFALADQELLRGFLTQSGVSSK